MDNAANNLTKIPVVSHASGSSSLVLGIAGTTLPSQPFRITAITGATYGTSAESLTIFGVTAVAANTPSAGQCTLTVSAIEGTADQAYGSSDYAECRLTAGTISDIQSAVTTLQTSVGTVPAGVLKGASGALAAAVAGADFVAPSGSITGTSSNVTGTVAVAHGGTGLTATPANGQLPIGNGTGYTLAALAAGSGIQITNSAGGITIAATAGGGGTVTSVGLSMPGGFSVAGSPVTTSGTLAVTSSISGIVQCSAGAFSAVTIGSGLSFSGGTLSATGGGGSGTVTSVSVVSANGMAGTVATATTTPAITLTTTVTGIVKGNGTALSAAVAGTDYVVPSGSITGTAANVTGVVAAANGGTGQSTYATGDMLYAGGASAIAKLAGNTSTTREFLTSTGTGTGANAPAWSAIAAADVPVFVASGASHAPGAVPDPGATAGTTRYLREDATWATPTGGGGSPGGSSGQLQYNNSGAFGGAADLAVGSSGQLSFTAIAAPASPSNGDTWHDSTQHAQAYRQSGLTIYRPGLVYSQTASVSATAAAATSLVSTTGALGTVSLPAGFLNVAGRTLRIRAGGYGSTGTSAVGNLGLGIFLGAVPVGSNGNEVLNTNQTSTPWYLEATVTTVATGASGTLQVAGALTGKNPSASLWSPAQTTNVTNSSAAFLTTPQTPVSIDLTAAYALDLQANLTATGNTITLTTLVVEVLG